MSTSVSVVRFNQPFNLGWVFIMVMAVATGLAIVAVASSSDALDTSWSSEEAAEAGIQMEEALDDALQAAGDTRLAGHNGDSEKIAESLETVKEAAAQAAAVLERARAIPGITTSDLSALEGAMQEIQDAVGGLRADGFPINISP